MADEFMADESIEHRLRELARDAEPLVVLAGAAAARGRGERRRARRRAGVLALVAAVALGAGSWQVLPRLAGSGDGAATTPAATAPGPVPDGLAQRLRDHLPPVDAMPLYPKYPWAVVPEGAAAKYREPCPVDAMAAGSLARASRVYEDRKDRLVAFAHLYAFGDAARAQSAFERFDEMGKWSCWPQGLTLFPGTPASGKAGSGKPASGGAGEDSGPGKGGGSDGPSASLTLSGGSSGGPSGVFGDSADGRTFVLVERQGLYAAVLFVTDQAAPRYGRKPVPGVGGAPAACMDQALSRLNAEVAATGGGTPSPPARVPTSPSPDPYGTPSSTYTTPDC